MTKTSAQEALTIQSEIDAVLRQWKSVLAILTDERKATFALCDKVDKISLLTTKPINSSDKKEIQSNIKSMLEAQSKIEDLRSQLCQKINNDHHHDQGLIKARTSLERLALTLPRKLENLKEKDSRLKNLSQKRTEILVKIQQIRNAGDQSTPAEQGLAISNLQYEVNRCLNEYACLEREVTSSGVEFKVANDVQTLKSAWFQCSRPKELPIISTSSSPCSTTNESCVSPTTCSQSSFMSDESQLDFDALASAIEKELQSILDQATALHLAVHDPMVIRGIIDQQQTVMKQLEAKRETLEGLASKFGAKEHMELSSRLGVLRDQLDVTKHRVLSRKSECTAMVSDSEQFARKWKEIESWLTRLDGIYQATFPMGQTLDVLECQHTSAMDALKELSKYEHHIRLFMQVSGLKNQFELGF